MKAEKLAPPVRVVVTDKHGLRNTIIGGVTVAAIVALVRPVWRFVVACVQWMGQLLTQTVTLPVWLLLLVAGALIVALVVALRLGRRRGEPAGVTTEVTEFYGGGTPAPVSDQHATPDPALLAPLDDLQTAILGKYGAHQTESALLHELYALTGANRLLLDDALDRLVELGFLERFRSFEGGIGFRLTPAGRGRVIRGGLT